MAYPILLPFMFLSAIAPVDFGGAAVDFTFGPGVSRLCVEVTIEDDDILEDEEDFFATLTTTDPDVILNPDEARVVITEDPMDSKSYCTCYCNAVVLLHCRSGRKLTYTNIRFHHYAGLCSLDQKQFYLRAGYTFCRKHALLSSTN